MSKARLYAKLKATWREWDEDVYGLATSMIAGFQNVLGSEGADPLLVAEIRHIRDQTSQYELWRASSRKAG